MSLCKYSQYISHSSAKRFDQLSEPESIAAATGINRCEECGEEVVSLAGRVLPASNHHKHAYGKGPIRWRVVVMTQANKSKTTS